MNREKVLLVEATQDLTASCRIQKIQENRLVNSLYAIQVVYTVPNKSFYPTDLKEAMADTTPQETCNGGEAHIQHIVTECATILDLHTPPYLLLLDSTFTSIHQVLYLSAVLKLQQHYPWVQVGTYGKNKSTITSGCPSLFHTTTQMKKVEGIIRQALFL